MSVEVQTVESISKSVSVSVNSESIPKPNSSLSELMGLQLVQESQESVSDSNKIKSTKSCNNEETSELMGLQLVPEFVSETCKTKSPKSCNEEFLEVEALSLSYSESNATDLSVVSNFGKMIRREIPLAESDEPSWWDRLCVPTIEESYGPVCGDPSLDVIDDIVSLPPTISDVLNELNTPKLSTYFTCIPLLEEVSSDGSESQEAPCDNFKWYGENDI
eukprot:CAMPEP_0194274440 /NCGR_PEP_ID=MMETSP0169-20130528/7525_1 /TAXON_ID=218684 /ORGANISM="Corethron pennatum, Strain L29A3" /LENGTH=218 /DNA_ID=CAMNT_0039017635 /DNA_START=355 /DNA_END=1011 /DNA_ORIENTATION=-